MDNLKIRLLLHSDPGNNINSLFHVLNRLSEFLLLTPAPQVCIYESYICRCYLPEYIRGTASYMFCIHFVFILRFIHTLLVLPHLSNPSIITQITINNVFDFISEGIMRNPSGSIKWKIFHISAADHICIDIYHIRKRLYGFFV